MKCRDVSISNRASLVLPSMITYLAPTVITSPHSSRTASRCIELHVAFSWHPRNFFQISSFHVFANPGFLYQLNPTRRLNLQEIPFQIIPISSENQISVLWGTFYPTPTFFFCLCSRKILHFLWYCPKKFYFFG